MKSLIIDDKQDNRYFLERLLESEGCEVTSAVNGADALEKLHSETFNLIISDILMPTMDGFQLLNKIKADNTLKDIPFIFFTATYTDDKDKEFGLSLGADKYLMKPMDPEALLKIIQGILKDCEAGKFKSKLPVATEESEIFKLYSQRLVHKLEQKTLELKTEIIRRNEVEEQLIKLGSAIEQSQISTVITDLEGNICYVNPAVCKSTGYSSQELLGSNPSILKGGELSEDDYKKLWEIILSGKEWRGEFHNKKKNGELYWESAIISPILNNNGDITHFLAVKENITERKLAEKERISLETQLRQSQKLEAVGTMASGIAHDFNNIMQGLYLYSGIIKDQLPDDEQLKSNFQHIVESGERAKNLVKQILTFSRKEETDYKPTKIQYILKDVLKLIRASTPTTIEISEDIDTNCGAILCDATQINQVFVNLCNNAVHAMMDNGGALSVSLHEMDAQIDGGPASTGDKFVELVVSDKGHGMDIKTLEKIFDPFFTTKSVDEGTGLGLSIVHGIIKNMGGQIKVDSKPGKGSTFRLLMPLSADEEQPEEIQKETGKELKGLRVLLVDDDTMISGAGKYILEDKDCIVDVANNGYEALELFQKDIKAYDLIITDLTMPKMTGLELGKAVRKLSEDVLMVLTSGNLDLKLRSEFKALGFNGFIRKPWTTTEMLKVINSLDLS